LGAGGLPPLVPLDQIAYFGEHGGAVLTLEGPTILRVADVIMDHDLVKAK
jgi:hypothetical protein